MAEPSDGSQSLAGRSPFERFLGLFTEVRAGEGLLATILFLNIFLVLNAYYVLKPIRDSLIGNAQLLGLEGDELKAYLSAVMAFFLIFFIRGYSALGSRVRRIQLLNISGAFVVVFVVVFYLLLKVGRLEGAGIAIAYFVWLGMVNNFIIAQFWSFANDIYTEQQGKRLFALIAVGQSTGAIVGSFVSRTFGKEHMFTLLLSAAGVLGLCIVLYNAASRRAVPVAKADIGTEEGEPLSKEGGFSLVLKSRYLFSIALMILVANLVNTTGENLITRTFLSERDRLYPANMYTAEWVESVQRGITELPSGVTPDRIRVIDDEVERQATLRQEQKGYGTSFYGDFYFWVNLLGALIQAFLVSRVFKFAGVRAAVFFLPFIALGGNLLFGIVGTWTALRIGKTAENSTDYSLQNTVKQALFLPTTRAEKYKAKAAIDTFFVRLGDAGAAGLWALGLHVFGFGTQGFAFVNVGLCGVWLLLCTQIFKEHKARVPTE